MSDLDQVQLGILEEGLGDVVGLWQVANHVRDLFPGADVDRVRRESMVRIRPLLETALIAVGELGDGAVHVAWPVRGPGAATRLDDWWRALGRHPKVIDNVWFANLPRGDAAARGGAGG